MKKFFEFIFSSFISMVFGGLMGILITFIMLKYIQKPECWLNNPNPVVFNEERQNLIHMKQIIDKRIFNIDNNY